MKALFKSHNLIGDALNISPAWRTWIKNKLELTDGNLDITMSTLPDHIAPLYQGMVRDLVEIKTVFNRPEGNFDFDFDFNVSMAFKLCDINKYHIAEGYAEMLGVKLDGGLERLKPIYLPVQDEVDVPENTILVSMFSASCEGRDPKCNYIPNKQLPTDKWKPILNLIRKEYPNFPVRFLGAPEHIEDVDKNNMYAKDIVGPGECMFGIPLNRLALIMQKAKLLVTIDNGMSHLGASQETNMFLMYPRCLGPHYILPLGNPNLVWCHMEPVHVNPAQICHGLSHAISKFKTKE
jgi:hypothetical protein